ncbi:hypothetical protein SBV1_140009 [Verrucomicrobia bacterium]|nr:hypothetical protein SBV1_140009 [Verrucomicrobiota bacterium]
MTTELAQERERTRSVLGSLRLPRFLDRGRQTPRVIAVEGPNGAGKTTLCRALAETLRAPYCLGTDAAWFSPALKTRMIREAEWFASAMFFFSGCFEQMRVLRNRSEPLMIMDRSLWSTLAVHGAEKAERLEVVLAMLRPIAAEIQVPDFTVVLDASFASCQARIAKKEGLDRALDQLTATEGFHAREQEFYRWLGRERPELAFLGVDEAEPHEVLERALDWIRELVP